MPERATRERWGVEVLRLPWYPGDEEVWTLLRKRRGVYQFLSETEAQDVCRVLVAQNPKMKARTVILESGPRPVTR